VEKGTLIEFWHNGERRLAIADRPEGKKHWIAIDSSDRNHTLHPRDITYTVAEVTCKKTVDITEFWHQVEPNLDPDSLEVAWEMLVEDGGTIDPPGLADLLYAERTPPLCYAAHILLSDDKLYFKNKKEDNYEPRPRTQVSELKHQASVKDRKEQEQQGFVDRINRQLAGEEIPWTDGDKQRLQAIEKFALDPDTAPHSVNDSLAALNIDKTAAAAFDLLVKLRLWSSHENLALRRSQAPTYFSNKVDLAMQQVLSSPPIDPDPHRADLTHLKVYTIDDESTTEIDDGLGVEFLPDGRERLWIHIADPTRLLIPGDDLDLEARKRSTTIYLPTGMIPMFPIDLAAGPMSLIQGKVCGALSFGVILDETGAAIDYQITTSTIKPTYRLTYEDVDEMLQLKIQGEPEIHALNRLAILRNKWRHSQGAIEINLPEAQIKVVGDEVSIDVLEDSRSRELVAEMMILAGEIGAKYGQTHQLPLPYRGQPQPELPPEEELMLLPTGVVRSSAVRRCMPRSEMGTSPARHASLGLDTYMQITSPIRRYTDLLAHFQIKAHLRGEELPYNGEQLHEMMMAIGTNTYEATMVERQTNRYWTLEFLNRQGTQQVWDAIVLRWLREDESLALILLDELGVELAMRLNRWADLGERIRVQIPLADPRQDVIHVREVVGTIDS
jgi:exoribonuclease II